MKNLLFPNRPGRFSAGLAKKPPKVGPAMEPKLQTRGMIENALGCSSFSGTISATIVRIMPTEIRKMEYKILMCWWNKWLKEIRCRQYLPENAKNLRRFIKVSSTQNHLLHTQNIISHIPSNAASQRNSWLVLSRTYHFHYMPQTMLSLELPWEVSAKHPRTMNSTL